MRLTVRRGATGLLCLLAVCILLRLLRGALECPRRRRITGAPSVSVRDWQHTEYRYGRDAPLVFVGGVPRSGTTLMRAMLDAHPHVRCGEETRVIPRLLALRQGWARPGQERQRLEEAGVNQEVLDSAVAAFLLEVIARHGEPAPLLCNKDPFTLKSAVYLSHLFPNTPPFSIPPTHLLSHLCLPAYLSLPPFFSTLLCPPTLPTSPPLPFPFSSKFLLMLRDGRAAVHSMISRRVTIAGFDLSSYRDCLSKWSRAVEAMLAQCVQVGSARCMTVRYESLVLQPRATLQAVLRFLDVPWHEGVLHHEEAIGQLGGVSLSRIERSTDQVIKPVNMEALTRWVGHIPADVLADMAEIAPMLSRLGYNPNANPPAYGQPDPVVVNNTERVLRGDFKTPASLKGQPAVYLNNSNTER